MNPSGNLFTRAGMRLVAAAALAVTLAAAPGMVLSADKGTHESRTELRIKDMHAKLNITAAQEEQWSKVAQAMRDDAATMDTLTQARRAHTKDMNAIDDLKSYGEIADAHANGIKKLIPLFSDLYAGMSDAQKKQADTLFRRGGRHSHHHKHEQKAPESK